MSRDKCRNGFKLKNQHFLHNNIGLVISNPHTTIIHRDGHFLLCVDPQRFQFNNKRILIDLLKISWTKMRMNAHGRTNHRMAQVFDIHFHNPVNPVNPVSTNRVFHKSIQLLQRTLHASSSDRIYKINRIALGHAVFLNSMTVTFISIIL